MSKLHEVRGGLDIVEVAYPYSLLILYIYSRFSGMLVTNLSLYLYANFKLELGTT